MSFGRKMLVSALSTTACAAAGVIYALEKSVSAGDYSLHAPHYHWSHDGLFSTLDMASVRRGYEVYKNVCAACHSLDYIAFRMLVGYTHDEEGAKAEAEAVQILDGPDDTGKMFMRPGKLSDHFPNPYPNEEAARYANSGSLPPDLTWMVPGRHGGENYVFSLLTGYMDPPAGVELNEGQYFNPYFAGGAIGMPPPLYNEIIEYADGTPATLSQLSKDVSTFLVWAFEPFYDDKKRMAWKGILIGAIALAACYSYQRHKFVSLKARKHFYDAITSPVGKKP